MATLTGLQVATLAYQAGIPINQLPTCVAIAYAESGLRTDAVGINPGPRPGTVASRDRGLWQINDYYHPDVSDACAFDPACNATAMTRISSGGTNWNPWSTFTNGAYQRYLAAGQLATHLLTEGAGGAQTPTGGTVPGTQGPNAADNAAAAIRNGQNPLQATVNLVQSLFDSTMDRKYGPNHRTGSILAGYFRQ